MIYLQNAWYVGALSTEVCRTPFRRVLLEQPVVFFREEAGAPVALFDRCPHRFVPLSRGAMRGDLLECGYHGLRFDRSGSCMHNPHGSAIPGRAQVRSFPVIERYGFVWIWFGDAERPDESLLPQLSPFADPRFTSVYGHLSIGADYQLVTDNLLDLSHVEFLHPAFASENVLGNTRIEFFGDARSVQVNRWKPNAVTSRFLRLFWHGEGERSDSRANMRWEAPCNLFLDLGTTGVDRPVEEGVSVPIAHLLAPETPTSTHYFWAAARDCALEDTDLTARLAASISKAFEMEDEPMIEAQQREIGAGTDLMSLQPVLLTPDVPAVRARRILAALIAAERTGAANRRPEEPACKPTDALGRDQAAASSSPGTP